MNDMRIKAANKDGYVTAEVYDAVFTEFPGKSGSPVVRQRLNSITTWSGG